MDFKVGDKVWFLEKDDIEEYNKLKPKFYLGTIEDFDTDYGYQTANIRMKPEGWLAQVATENIYATLKEAQARYFVLQGRKLFDLYKKLERNKKKLLLASVNEFPDMVIYENG